MSKEEADNEGLTSLRHGYKVQEVAGRRFINLPVSALGISKGEDIFVTWDDGNLVVTARHPDDQEKKPQRTLNTSQPVEPTLPTVNLDELEREAVIQAIAANPKNMSAVIRSLGCGRTTFYRKVKQFGLEIPRQRRGRRPKNSE